MSKQAFNDATYVVIGSITATGVGSILFQAIGALLLGIMGAIGGYLFNRFLRPRIDKLLKKKEPKAE